MADSWFGLVWFLFCLCSLLPPIYLGFFLSECTLVMAMEIFSTLMHINTCFSCEAFIIHS